MGKKGSTRKSSQRMRKASGGGASEKPPPPLTWLRASIDTTDPAQMKMIRSDPVISPPSQCQERECIDLSGIASTGSDGRKTWRFTDYNCYSDAIPEEPASFIATPVTDRPIHLTAKITFQSSPKDLVVEIFTWDANGNPAPSVRFSWRCRVIRISSAIP